MSTTPFAAFRALTFRGGFYAWTAMAALAFLPVAPFANARTMRRYAAVWEHGVQGLLRLTLGLRYRVDGLDRLPTGPVILAAKHQSAWETIIFHTIRPDLVVGIKEELARIPIFGWYLRIGHNILIDRRGAARALRSLVEGAKAAVAQGESILIFPEGTRRAPDAPPDYKPGIAAVYAALDIPVVPVALNSGLFWGPGTFAKRAGTIRVELLEPIPPGLDRRRFMALLEEQIETGSRALVAAGRAELAARG